MIHVIIPKQSVDKFQKREQVLLLEKSNTKPTFRRVMKFQINICYFLALVLIFDIANGKYLLVEVDGEEKTFLKDDCKGTSCDITNNIVGKL